MTSTVEGPSSASFFPLATLSDVANFFSAQLDATDPDLALLSIVIGALEHQWTATKNAPVIAEPSSTTASASSSSSSTPSHSPCDMKVDPPLEWHVVDALQTKFASIIEGFCDPALLAAARNEPDSGFAVRPLVKHVADIVWNTLSKSQYKDRPHLQSIYSYLTGNKLDCFGVAFAVVAACQLLEVPEVHLALSEDHAWVVFGKDGTETAEVTWHGKGNEDKRGQPVEISKAKTSWLYVAGQPVVCDRHMEVSSMVSSINPAISANVDSIECGTMQQELLWMLYDKGHLKNYPMALANLGDCEEISSSLGRQQCAKLFAESIQVNQKIYSNHHVYPYTYQAGYYYRTKQFKKALEGWAAAADVIKLYKYSKDDEEIYKEFMEIANELIPHTVKTASLNPQTYRDVLQDPECFSYLLKFYDGICSWEEDSQTPVLHIGWAKPMVNTCSKFDAEIRARVDIPREADDEDHDDEDEEEEEEGIKNHDDDERKKRVPEQVEKEEVEEVEEKRLLNNNYYYKDGKLVPGDVDGKQKCDNVVGRIDSQNSPMFDDACSLVESGEKINLIQSLTEGCGENVLNLEFLLGRRDSNPFLVDDKSSNSRRVSISLLKRRRRLWKKRKRMAQLKRRILKMTKTNLSESSSSSSGAKEGTSTVSKKHQKRVSLKLHSVKMRGLKELLCSEKLNTSAIQLQLTAQSQTEVKRGAGKGEEGGSGDLGSGRPKRARRE